MSTMFAEGYDLLSAEKVFAFFRYALLDGSLKPGERELSLRLGMSRPLLREAVRLPCSASWTPATAGATPSSSLRAPPRPGYSPGRLPRDCDSGSVGQFTTQFAVPMKCQSASGAAHIDVHDLSVVADISGRA